MKKTKKDFSWDTLSGRLRYLMREIGVNQNEFAKICGVSANYISMLVTGRRKSMSEPLYRLICQNYNVNPKWLHTGEGPPYLDDELNDVIILREELNSRIDDLDSASLRLLLAVLSNK